MKNLYKIQNELYIIDNNDKVTQNGIWARCSFTGDILRNRNGQNAYKVILTTNKLLIKDGVQAIDDEFLQWIVKNPSCEEVEINSVIILKESRDETDYPEFDYYNYEIIIPKEEPKTKCYCGHTSYCDCGPLEPKQEILSWDELVKEAGSEEELVKILKLPHIAPLVREAMINNRKNKL
jgi:hypothetical protein